MAEYTITQDSRYTDYYSTEADSPEEAMQQHFEGDSYCHDSECMDSIGGPEILDCNDQQYRDPLRIVSYDREDGTIVLSESELIIRHPYVPKTDTPPPKREGGWFEVWMP